MRKLPPSCGKGDNKTRELINIQDLNQYGKMITGLLREYGRVVFLNQNSDHPFMHLASSDENIAAQTRR